MALSDDDSKQLEMYRTVKELMQQGRITLLQSSDNSSTITISVELTKNGKSIKKIRQELDSGYGYR
ncbi:predicted ORF [Xanthomonas phage XacN1]|nr:predicted ORF [Xanthomonas phage XacN1]